MIVYSWQHDAANHSEASCYFRTLREARASLKDLLLDSELGAAVDTTVFIYLEDLGRPSPAKVLRILNGEGYVERHEEVEGWAAKSCGRCDACESEMYSNCTAKKVTKAR